LKKLFANGVVKREEMWITSKLWFVLLYLLLKQLNDYFSFIFIVSTE